MDLTKPSMKDLESMIIEKNEDIEYMLSTIREIYAISGEDTEISRLCNSVISESRIPIN